jgi:hypothetical protein
VALRWAMMITFRTFPVGLEVGEARFSDGEPAWRPARAGWRIAP